MKIEIKLRQTKGEAKTIAELFKEVEELAKKYSIISEIDIK